MISEQGPPGPLHADDTPTEIIQAIGPEQTGLPAPSRTRSPSSTSQIGRPARTRERRQLRMSGALVVVILGVLGVAGYKVASGVGSKPRAVAAAADTSVTSRPSAAPSTASPSVSPAPSPTTATASPSASPVAVVARTLKPVGVTAVGPGGATGDDAGAADFVIDGSMSTSWQTDWYDTAGFGGLQTGTGLLIDMGRTVTITSVQVTLGPQAGNDLEVRVGDSSKVSYLATVATEAGAGGTIELKLASPAHARYVLIWFTKLAPDGSGTYQAKVYNVGVDGQG